jgi:hypothetical protein
VQETRILLHLTRAVRFEIAFPESLLCPRKFFRLLCPLDFVLKENQETVTWVHVARERSALLSVVQSQQMQRVDGQED